MFRRQAARVQEEPIPEDLIANIPVVGRAAETTVFAVESKDIILVPPPPAPEDAPGPAASAVAPTPEAAPGAALAAQLRYEMGEAFARELDRAESAFVSAIGELEARLKEAQDGLARANDAAEREREMREQAEARLKAFKELALR